MKSMIKKRKLKIIKKTIMIRLPDMKGMIAEVSVVSVASFELPIPIEYDRPTIAAKRIGNNDRLNFLASK